MGFQDDQDKAFRQERFGFGAGIPTSLGGTLGQISARQQKDLASGSVRGGAGGHLILDMLAGGAISRGILVLVVGLIISIAGANSGLREWIGAGLMLGTLTMLAGCGMIAFGIVRKVIRAVR